MSTSAFSTQPAESPSQTADLDSIPPPSSEYHNCIRTIGFGWLDEMFAAGAARPLQPDDLPPLHSSQSCAAVVPVFSRAWDQIYDRVPLGQERDISGTNEPDRCCTVRSTCPCLCPPQPSRRPSLWAALMLVEHWRLYGSICLSVISRIVEVGRAVLLQALIASLGGPSEDQPDTLSWHEPAMWAGALAVATIALVFIDTHRKKVASEAAIDCHTGIAGLLHAKLLHLPATSVSKGAMSTLVGTDASDTAELMEWISDAFGGPLAVAAAYFIAWRLMGLAVVAAIGVLLLMLPLNAWVASVFETAEKRLLRAQQSRMKVLGEAISAIEYVKIYSMEGVVGRRIQRHRVSELNAIRAFTYSTACLSSLFWCASTLQSCAAFAAFHLMGGVLTPEIVFPCLFCFQMALWEMMGLPDYVGGIVAAAESIRRLSRFLVTEKVHGGDAMLEYTILTDGPEQNAGPGRAASESAWTEEVGVALSTSGQMSCKHFDVPAWLNDDSDSDTGSDDDSDTSSSGCSRKSSDSSSAEHVLASTDNYTIPGDVTQYGQQYNTGPSGAETQEPDMFLELMCGCCCCFGPKHNRGAARRLRGSSMVNESGMSSCEDTHESRRSPSINSDSVNLSLHEPLLSQLQPSAAPTGAPTVRQTSSQRPVLNRVRLQLRLGEFVGVVGPVGSSKTSLLLALLGELRRLDNVPSRRPQCRVAYVPQEPWVQSATIRENVLIGETGWQKTSPGTEQAIVPDEARYRAALRAARLHRDLQDIEGGDLAELGERGVTISGGQKARICLARAMYSQPDVYLLDDPLSAVDAHTQAWLFRHAILGRMLGRQAGGTQDSGHHSGARSTRNAAAGNAAVVLISSHEKYLSRCDRVVVMENGRIAHCDSYQNLVEQGALTGLGALSRSVEEPSDENPDSSFCANAHSDDTAALSTSSKRQDELEIGTAGTITTPVLGGSSESNSINGMPLADRGNSRPQAAARLIEAEERYEGLIGASVYWEYFQSLGGCSFLLLFGTLSICLQLVRQTSTVWIALWAGGNSRGANGGGMLGGIETSVDESVLISLGLTQTDCLVVFLGLGLVGTVLSAVRNVVWFRGAVDAAKQMHTRMLGAVLLAPLSFFQTSPQGRILNRFSEDVGEVDSALPEQLNGVLMLLVSNIFMLGAVAVASPWFLVLVPVVVGCYWHVVHVFRASARELKRLEAIAESPVHQKFTETAEGIVSIRAYRLEARERQELWRAIDKANTVEYAQLMGNLWVTLRIDILGCIIVAAACGLAVVATVPGIAQYMSGRKELLAMSVTEASGLLDGINYLVQGLCAVETDMARVERIMHYQNIAPEGKMRRLSQSTAVLEDKRPDIAGKPGKFRGQGLNIVFEDVWARYRPGLPDVLRGISLRVPAGSNCLIVGRTGSGKSSLLSCLLGTIQPYRGSIRLGGRNISESGLRDLRECFSVVPQDGAVLSGTVRSILSPQGPDPFLGPLSQTAFHRRREAAGVVAGTGSGVSMASIELPQAQSSVANELEEGLQWDPDLGRPAASCPSDAALWASLETVGLANRIRGLNGGLDAAVGEGGRGLSAGERQLLCLARALLRGSPVLVLDEAWSSVPGGEGAAMQQALKKCCEGRTVLSVAHRLDGVRGFDWVIVVEGGRVVEEGRPSELLALGEGVLCGLARGSPVC